MRKIDNDFTTFLSDLLEYGPPTGPDPEPWLFDPGSGPGPEPWTSTVDPPTGPTPEPW